MFKILIADDHAVVREGLKQILAKEFPQAEFRGSATIAETLKLLKDRSWDILVLDLFISLGVGLSFLQKVRQDYPGVPVLVLSSAPEEQLGLPAFRAGASGYLNKQSAPEHLVNAVRKVLEGGKFVTAILAELLAEEVGRKHPLHEKLSQREFEVLRLVVKGRSLKEIAGDLSLSVKTIRTFHARLLEKLQLQNDVDLVYYAQKHLLIEGGGLSSFPPECDGNKAP